MDWVFITVMNIEVGEVRMELYVDTGVIVQDNIVY